LLLGVEAGQEGSDGELELVVGGAPGQQRSQLDVWGELAGDKAAKKAHMRRTNSSLACGVVPARETSRATNPRCRSAAHRRCRPRPGRRTLPAAGCRRSHRRGAACEGQAGLLEGPAPALRSPVRLIRRQSSTHTRGLVPPGSSWPEFLCAGPGSRPWSPAADGAMSAAWLARQAELARRQPGSRARLRAPADLRQLPDAGRGGIQAAGQATPSSRRGNTRRSSTVTAASRGVVEMRASS
jgi:hypothetical protein